MEAALKYAITLKEVMNVIVDRYLNWLLMERPVIVSIYRSINEESNI